MLDTPDTLAPHPQPLRSWRTSALVLSVALTLLPGPVGAAPDKAGPPAAGSFDVVVNQMPAREFFMTLMEGSKQNILVGPDISGYITLRLSRVSLEDTLRAVRDTYGYEYVKTPYGYQISSNNQNVRVFAFNYLDVTRSGRSETQVSGRSVEKNRSPDLFPSESTTTSQTSTSSNRRTSDTISTQITTLSSMDFWKELQGTLTQIMGTHGFAVVNPQAGTVVVSTTSPDLMRMVENYLRQTETSLMRQVTIEAKILVVELNDGFQQGINWQAIGTLAANKTITTSLASVPLSNPDQIGGVLGVNFNLNDFTGVLELLETQGNIQVLSSPRITAMNNQKAVIKVGSDEFFVTNVSTTTNTSGSSTVTTPEVTLTPFFSGVALDITPQISADNQIILHVHPSVSEVQDQNKLIDLGNNIQLQLPLAFSRIRESDTMVRAEPGKVLVIGGLMQTLRDDTTATVPLLGRIPLLKYLFQQQRKEQRKTELVILIRPVLPENVALEQFIQFHGAKYGGLKRTDFADDSAGTPTTTIMVTPAPAAVAPPAPVTAPAPATPL